MTTLIRTQAQRFALTSPRARRGVRRVELAVPGYAREVRRLQHQINRNLRARVGAGASVSWRRPAGVRGSAVAAAVGPRCESRAGTRGHYLHRARRRRQANRSAARRSAPVRGDRVVPKSLAKPPTPSEMRWTAAGKPGTLRLAFGLVSLSLAFLSPSFDGVLGSRVYVA